MTSDNWTEVRLGDLIHVKHGFAFQGEFFSDSPTQDILLTPGNFAIGGGFKLDKLKYYSGPVPEDFVLTPGSLLITMTDLSKESDTLGLPAIVPTTNGLRLLHNQRLGLVQLRDPSAINVRYLYYRMCSRQYRNEIIAGATGTTVKHTSPARIENFLFRIPPLPIQQQIADILGAFDDKIELNRRTNETLEAMARRLFTSWFVDFEPVHSKSILRRTHPKRDNAEISRRALPNIVPEVAELFPDGFEDSVLGSIPKGWRSRPLYDIARFVNGAAFKNSDFCDPAIGKPVVKIAELKSGIDAQTKFSQKDVGPEREIRCGDTLYSWSGSPDTSLATFRWTGRDGLLNQHIFKVITANRPDEVFAYYQLNELHDTLVEIARNKQTTGLGHVTVEDMKRLQVVHPASDILKAFADLAGPIYDQSFSLSVDSLTLQKTRDKLLPRLLSGELLT